jgi:hypothetical protein
VAEGWGYISVRVNRDLIEYCDLIEYRDLVEYRDLIEWG